MQDADLKLLPCEEDFAWSLVRGEYHFRAVDQPFDAGFNPGEGSIGHDACNDRIMNRTHREISRGVLPGIGRQALQTQGNATALCRDIQDLYIDLLPQPDNLVWM